MTTTNNTNIDNLLQTDGWNPLNLFSKRNKAEKMSEEDEDLYYSMVDVTNTNSSFRGRCLILNYEKFSHSDSRAGSQVDVRALTKTFSDLSYEVIVHQDLTVMGTKIVLDSESKVDHRRYDSFVLCFLSHGLKDDVLLCSNGEIDEDLLIDSFTPENCSTLAGKPKMIFVQACRGSKLDPGYQMLAVDGTGCFGNSDSSTSLVPVKIPTHADFLIYRSTFKGFFSWRNPVNGSWFIQDLTSVFQSNQSKGYDLLTLLTLVNRRVGRRQSRVPVDQKDDDEERRRRAEEMNGKKEMPVFSSTLTKLVRFTLRG